MTKKEDKNLNCPRLRFPGFTAPWEQRRLLDCVERVIDYRGRTPKKLGLDWAPTGYLALSALNVKDGFIDTSVEAHYANQELYDKWMGDAELKQGQVLFTTEAPMGNVAQVPDNKGYILSQRTIAFATQKNIILDSFLAISLKSYSVFSKLESLSSGGTAKGISQKSLAEVSLLLPKNLKEQEKIADIFSSLNRFITLHQRESEELKRLKKSLLQKMFPKEGALVPELRFPGFTDPWEQSKLENVLDVNSGRDYKGEGLGNIPVYGTGGYMLSISRALSYDRDAIGIGRKGTINNPFILKAPFWTVDTLFYAVPKNPKSLDFLYAFFQSVDWSKKDESTGVPSLSKSAINRTLLKIPTEEEQEEIGNFFLKLTDLITLHQRKLETLKKLKKGLLQQMFI